MNPLFRIATILFALIIAASAAGHFVNADSMVGYVPSYLPGGVVWVYVSGAALAMAAISFIINVKSKLAGYLLALLIVVFIATIHLPTIMALTDSAAKQVAMVGMMKDVAMVATSLMIAANGK